MVPFMRRSLWLVAIAMALATSAEDRNQDREPETAQKILRVTLPDARPESRPLELVRIPAGTFLMGCPADERGRVGREWPPHRVTLTKAFYLGRYEVTQGQWRAVMGANPAVGGGWGADYPVHHVSWADCQRFIERLNTLGQGTFRMPTEAEWDFQPSRLPRVRKLGDFALRRP
jgi:formylglycine-generating enzyme required for sulfatase activity